MAICKNTCCGCELIKTNKVLCQREFVLDINQELTATIPNEGSPEPLSGPLTVSNFESQILSTGCQIEYDANNNIFTITFTGFLVCESFTLTDGNNNTQDVEILERICTPQTIEFSCKLDPNCVTNPKCQLESLSGITSQPEAEVLIPSGDILITQTLETVTANLKIDELVQLLVQLCQQIPGTVTINPE